MFGPVFPIVQLPCPKLRKPVVTARVGGRTTLGWAEGDTALYQLKFYSNDSTLLFETDTLTTNSFVLTDSLLNAINYSGDFNFKVRVRKICNYLDSPYHTLVWSAYSEPRNVYHLQGAPQGIIDVVMPELAVSPNPAKGSLTVEGDEGHLQLLDLEGREVKSCHHRGSRTTMDVSTLPRGVYLLRLTTAQGTASRRVMLM